MPCMRFLFCFTTVVYLDMKTLIVSNAIVVITNILRLIIHISGVMDNAESVGRQRFVSVLVSMLVAYASIRCIGLLIEFNKGKYGRDPASYKEAEGKP